MSATANVSARVASGSRVKTPPRRQSPKDRVLAQRMSSLEIANGIRFPRAEIKRRIRAGELPVLDVLREPSWPVLTMTVADLLIQAPGLGPVTRNRVLRRADVWPLKAVGSLTVRQKERIAQELGGGRA